MIRNSGLTWTDGVWHFFDALGLSCGITILDQKKHEAHEDLLEISVHKTCFSSTAYPFLLPLSVTVTSEDLSVDNIQAKVPLERSHNVLAAMLDVLFIVLPGLDGLVGMPGSELFPPLYPSSIDSWAGHIEFIYKGLVYARWRQPVHGEMIILATHGHCLLICFTTPAVICWFTIENLGQRWRQSVNENIDQSPNRKANDPDPYDNSTKALIGVSSGEERVVESPSSLAGFGLHLGVFLTHVLLVTLDKADGFFVLLGLT
ncbi:unnamed protein product [Zymoseptoria tritici ST99CH_1A5]|uniref:Uncharacterized protein n=1 Tax=Zymoseptoria tritici ST99CH_1A5 TaxID=1276529 RepID=A0A1Y6LHG2_ZYMTR|nr:unnamed protein product [Zymoseptoria tritici ST99CH_1A5]